MLDENEGLSFEALLLGDYLVILNGTEAEIGRAESSFGDRGIQDWSIRTYANLLF